MWIALINVAHNVSEINLILIQLISKGFDVDLLVHFQDLTFVQAPIVVLEQST